MRKLHARLHIAVNLEAAILKTAAKSNERQAGSALFSWLDRAQGVEDHLDDAVVFQGGQRDQLRSCSNNDPRCRMIKEVHVSR